MNPYVHVVYCDDVRQEMGNKFSIMGVYGADLLLASFPAMLPRLAAIISVFVPDELKPSQLMVRILLDEQVVFETPNLIGMAGASKSKDRSDPTDEQPMGTMYGVQALMSPMHFDKPARLRVLALLDDETVKGSSLAIKLRQE